MRISCDGWKFPLGIEKENCGDKKRKEKRHPLFNQSSLCPYRFIKCANSSQLLLQSSAAWAVNIKYTQQFKIVPERPTYSLIACPLADPPFGLASVANFGR